MFGTEAAGHEHGQRLDEGDGHQGLSRTAEALCRSTARRTTSSSKRGEHFPHNYNAVTRSAFYTFLNRHFKLGQPSPVIERDFDPLPAEQLTVWDSRHPAPKAADPEFERKLLKWFTEDADRQLRCATATEDGLQKILRPAVEVLIGRTYAAAGEVEGKVARRAGPRRLHRNDRHAGQQDARRGSEGRVALSEAMRTAAWSSGSMTTARPRSKTSMCYKLVRGGMAVVGADLLLQGGEPVKQTRVVANPREFAGYTFGYNHTLFAQRTHDVLTIVAFLRRPQAGAHPIRRASPSRGGAPPAPSSLAARAVAGEAIDRAAVDTGGFRFGKILDYRDPMFLPGGAKYLDLPGMIALSAPHPLWLAGEGGKPEVFGAKFTELTAFADDAAQKETSAVKWLSK